MACVLRPYVIGDLAVNVEAVIDEQLLIRLDRRERMNEYAIVSLNGFAIWVARVVQKSRTVPAATAIDDPSIRKTEHEGVPGLGSLTGGRTSPAGHFARVLDESLACSDRQQGKYARSMYRGAS
jgi:hypothetical protein